MRRTTCHVFFSHWFQFTKISDLKRRIHVDEMSAAMVLRKVVQKMGNVGCRQWFLAAHKECRLSIASSAVEKLQDMHDDEVSRLKQKIESLEQSIFKHESKFEALRNLHDRQTKTLAQTTKEVCRKDFQLLSISQILKEEAPEFATPVISAGQHAFVDES